MSGSDIHNFSYPLGGATFWIRIANEDYAYAQRATAAIFYHLETILPEIDVRVVDGAMTGINQMPIGGLVPVGDHFKTLWNFATELKVMSQGAFDVSAGKAFSHLGKQPQESSADASALVELIQLAQGTEWNLSGNEFCRIHGEGTIDFSALIQGYLCDVIADLLENKWGIHRALILVGGNKLLALDPPAGTSGWRLSIGETHQIALSRSAIISKFSAHSSPCIVNLLTGQLVSPNQPIRALAESALSAEGLACLLALIPWSEMQTILPKHTTWGAWLGNNTLAGVAQKLKVTATPSTL